jgi:hypothetical protein
MDAMTVIDSFVPEISMYGPAGISIVGVRLVPMGTFAGVVVVLICSCSDPASVTGPAVRLALSARTPATPPFVSSSEPTEICTVPKPPSGIVAPVTVTWTTVLVPLVVSVKPTFPVSVCPRNVSAMPVPVTLSWEVVLVAVTDRPSVPTSVTPGMETDTFALRFPVRPPDVPNVRFPVPPEIASRAFAPSPNEALTLLAATVTVPLWSVTENVPLTLCPPIVNCTPVPVTWKYGPAGSVRLTLVPPIWNCWTPAGWSCSPRRRYREHGSGRSVEGDGAENSRRSLRRSE